jgi:diketogulonate reductase-like aldo/keto reductase|tara:strand:+ start:23808 stop:24734 length:927 start_codon:yes stop_codon:yes gene_type:complete
VNLRLSRRHILRFIGSAALLGLAPSITFARKNPLQKLILSSGEKIPAIGMGTWQTFNVGNDPQLRRQRTDVLKKFFEYGGGMVDCSPMYGSSAEMVGYALKQLGFPKTLFSAEKIWTWNGDATGQQVSEQAEAWSLERFDLIQVHNLTSWQDHLANLEAMKQAGKIRYIGITTSHGRRHRELEKILQTKDLDFVQLTYNLTHREAEQRLLPLARERGIAVIANRPYDGGSLIKPLQRHEKVPAWAADELNCRTWADYLLRFIVSHPSVTCAIPATTQVAHMQENMEAGRGPMPDASQRQRMINDIRSL